VFRKVLIASMETKFSFTTYEADINEVVHILKKDDDSEDAKDIICGMRVWVNTNNLKIDF